MSDPVSELEGLLCLSIVSNRSYTPYKLGAKVSQPRALPDILDESSLHERVMVGQKYDGWSFRVELSRSPSGSRTIKVFNRNGGHNQEAESLIPHSAFTPLAYDLNAVFYMEGVPFLQDDGEWKPLTYKGVSMTISFCHWWNSHFMKQEGNRLKIRFYAYRLFSFGGINAGMVEGLEMTSFRVMQALITTQHEVVFPCSYEIAHVCPLDKDKKGIRMNHRTFSRSEFEEYLLERAKRERVEGFVCTFPDGKLGRTKPQATDWSGTPRIDHSVKVRKYFELSLGVIKTLDRKDRIVYVLVGVRGFSLLYRCGFLDYRFCSREVKSQLNSLPFFISEDEEKRKEDEITRDDLRFVVEVQCTCISDEKCQLEGVKSVQSIQRFTGDISQITNVESALLGDTYWKSTYNFLKDAKDFMRRAGYTVNGTNFLGKRSREPVFESNDEDCPVPIPEPPVVLVQSPLVVEPEQPVVLVLPIGIGPVTQACRRNHVKALGGSVAVTPSERVNVVLVEQSVPRDVTKRILTMCHPLAVAVHLQWLRDSINETPKALKPVRDYAIALD